MVAGFASVATSYPAFLADLTALAGGPVATDARPGDDAP